MTRVHISLLAVMVVAVSSCAGGERDLNVGKDGRLQGIPSSFGRVSLEVDGLDKDSPAISFRVGKAVNVLPACATAVIAERAINHVSASGLWGREESMVPSFVRVNFYESYKERYDYTSRVEVMFDLRTSETIDIRRFVKLTPRQGERMEELSFPAGCDPLGARPN